VSTIPVHCFQGRYDHQRLGELAEVYYPTLEAPVKSFNWFGNYAHDVFYDGPDKFSREVIRIANETLAEAGE
jgi:hypothetical protein